VTTYRVTFFRNLESASGHCFKCPQGTIELECAKSLDRALTAGKRRFERAKRIQDWTLYADLAELVAVDEIGHQELLLTSTMADNHVRSSSGPFRIQTRH